MKLGKLTTNELEDNVISLLTKKRKEVIATPAIGEDCGALKLDGIILVSSDPITAVMENDKLGALCISVCCNDIAANGGEPVAVTLTVIMPPTSSADEVGKIMRGAEKKAKELNIDIIGGHTEFSDCVTRPIVSGTAIGVAKRLLLKTDIKVGDKLIVTKSLALEGACILCDIKKPLLSKQDELKLVEFNGMLEVKREAELISSDTSVSAMHDITEGGILGAVAEICHSAGVGATVYEERMPVDELTKRLCKEYGVEPLRLISSGSMLIATSEPQRIIDLLQAENIPACVIGEVTDDNVVMVTRDGKREAFDVLPDEMYKFSGETE